MRIVASFILLCAVAQPAIAQPAISVAAELPSDVCVGDFPDAIEARLAQRDRMVALAHAASTSEVGLFSVFDSLKTWTPGQTIKVAFDGGSAQMRAEIAAAAQEWTQYANLKLDFGPAGTYRDWSPADTEYAADIRISFDYGGYWSLVGSDSTDSRLAASGLASMSTSTWATWGRAAHVWSTTRRTAAHGPHHDALKCRIVGLVVDRPRFRSLVSTWVAASAARSMPWRRVSNRPTMAPRPSTPMTTAMTTAVDIFMIV